MLASAAPRDYEIQPFKGFERDLVALSNQQMREALRLTHSDSGRHLASKLDTHLTHLAASYEYYDKLLSAAKESKQAENCDAIKTVLAQLLKFKYNLQRLIVQAARQGLDDVDEVYLARLEKLQVDIDFYIARQHAGKHIERIAHINFVSTIIYYGTVVASYMTKGLQGFLHSLPTLLSNLGRVFPPIIIALDAAKNIFDLVYSYATRSHLAEMEEQRGQKLASATLYSKGYYLRQAGNAIALALNAFTLLIFTGALFTTPFGWALSAAVVGAEWVASCIIPAWQARKNYKRMQIIADERETDPQAIEQQIRALDRARSKPVHSITGQPLTGAAAHHEIRRINREINRLNELKKGHHEISEKLQIAEKNYLNKRADALWCFCTIAGSILFACSFVCPPLLVFGVAPLLVVLSVGLLLASPVRSTINWLADKYAKYRKKASAGGEAEEPAPSAARTDQIQKALGIVSSIEVKQENSGSPRSANEARRPPSPPSSPHSPSASLRLLGDERQRSSSVELEEKVPLKREASLECRC